LDAPPFFHLAFAFSAQTVKKRIEQLLALCFLPMIQSKVNHLNSDISNRKGTIFSFIPRSIQRDISSITFSSRLFTFAGWLSQIKAISDSVCIFDNSVFFHLAFSEQAKQNCLLSLAFVTKILGETDV